MDQHRFDRFTAAIATSSRRQALRLLGVAALGATALPLMVDIDTGFGGVFNIARTVKSLIKQGAGALHMEDQVAIKRCGHRPGKAVVSKGEMVDRIKAAVDARTDPDFFIIARTDALAVEGIESAIERAVACKEAGADGVFPEAVTQLPQYGEDCAESSARRCGPLRLA